MATMLRSFVQFMCGEINSMANSDNPKVGREFQEFVRRVLEDKYKVPFYMEPAIPIGTPKKEHKFDLANKDRTIVSECKCYTWTDSGNVPSAKLMGLDEALFYFGFLPDNTIKLLCMKQATYTGKHETLAEYYCRVHGHLLKDVHVMEISEDGSIREISAGIKANKDRIL